MQGFKDESITTQSELQKVKRIAETRLWVWQINTQKKNKKSSKKHVQKRAQTAQKKEMCKYIQKCHKKNETIGFKPKKMQNWKKLTQTASPWWTGQA